MNYIEYNFSIHPVQPWTDIVIAKLSLIEFESFDETDTGVKAYILKDYDDEAFIQEQISELENVQISFEKNEIKAINWNEEWEKNFDPIQIGNQCYIRAEFHESKADVAYEIIIQPKMSFGTGHHETTHLMVGFLLEENIKDKAVLDMGTGTGILAILSKLKGAKEVHAIDIDEWAYTNAVENAARNHVEIEFHKGGAETIPSQEFDYILANINKNILMADLPFYVNALRKEGVIILSGIYNFDIDDIVAEAIKNGLSFEKQKERNEWVSLKFRLK